MWLRLCDKSAVLIPPTSQISRTELQKNRREHKQDQGKKRKDQAGKQTTTHSTDCHSHAAASLTCLVVHTRCASENHSGWVCSISLTWLLHLENQSMHKKLFSRFELTLLRQAVPLCSHSCKVLQQLAAKSGANAFRVELHPIQRQAAVGNCLHHSVCC